jgi:hypothetical protein
MKLKQGIDYYLENGRMVFTEAFLRARKRCCQSGCRHCPWRSAGSGKDLPPSEDERCIKTTHLFLGLRSSR